MTETEKLKILELTQDLEFVQLLANPNYIKYLNERNYFEDQAFLNYLNYLSYLKNPDYLKFIEYDNGLIMLDLLQLEIFRKEIKNDTAFLDYILEQNWLSNKNAQNSLNEQNNQII